MVSRGRRGRLRDEPEQRRQQRRDGDGLAGVLVAGALLVLGPGVPDAATGRLELLAHARHQRLVLVVARVGGFAPARRLLRIVPRRHCTGTLERTPLDTAGRVRRRTRGDRAPDGATKESNLPTDARRRLPGFEDPSGHRPRVAPGTGTVASAARAAQAAAANGAPPSRRTVSRASASSGGRCERSTSSMTAAA